MPGQHRDPRSHRRRTAVRGHAVEVDLHALVPQPQDERALVEARGDLVPVSAEGRLVGEGPLLFDHDQIVEAAVQALRSRYEIRYRYVDIHPDPDGFLSEPFTLHQLRKVHEAVVGAELHKDNFARRMKEHVEAMLCGGKPVLSDGLRGRPATLYRKRR
jgi:8-oxo-dGTP diphosphatase